MPTEFKIPELGENITSGDVVRLLVEAMRAWRGPPKPGPRR